VKGLIIDFKYLPTNHRLLVHPDGSQSDVDDFPRWLFATAGWPNPWKRVQV